MPLPWVIADGALAPLPDEFAPAFKLFGRDYLWATTSPDGDRCSTDGRPPAMAAYRDGRTLRVRYTFSGEGFLPWREALEANGQHALADAMLQYARHCGENPDKWFVRPDPLSLDDCLYVQVRSYRSHRWIELGASDLSEAGIVGFKVHDDAPVGDLENGSYFGVTLGDRTYFGRRYISRGGRAYDVGSINTAALLKYADLR